MALLVSLVLMASLPHAYFLQDLSHWGYDFLAVHAKSNAARNDVVIVDFDDRTQQEVKRYPIPRTIVAEVLQKVSAAKPQLIGLDLLLSEPRPAEDEVLAKEIAKAGNVVLASELFSALSTEVTPLDEFCKPDPQAPSYCSEGAFAEASVDLPVDEEGSVRRMFLLPPAGTKMLPFATMLATNFIGQGLRPGPNGTPELGGHAVPLDGSGLNTYLISGWNDKPVRIISASDVLKGGIGDSEFHGKLVLIGQSSEAGEDLHVTPLFRTRNAKGYQRLVSGTRVQAAAISTLLDGRSIALVPRKWTLVALFALAWLLLVLILSVRPAGVIVLTVAMAVATYGFSQWLFSARFVWFDFSLAGLIFVVVLPMGYGWRYVRENWLRSRVELERKELKTLFSRYVSAEIAEEIWRRRGEITLTGEERVATVLFSDIRDFTQTTAGKPSSEVVAWLNEYFEAMSGAIQSQGGFLNKFIGDGIMAVYGVPISHGDAEDARNAVRSALLMLEEVEKLNALHAGDPTRPPIRIGIGIHTGELTAGTVGASNRMEYSVIGETVNLASRLESLTKEQGVPIVLSAACARLMGADFPVERLGNSKVKGFSEAVEVYTVATKQAVAVRQV